jgi:hypothetical protein
VTTDRTSTADEPSANSHHHHPQFNDMSTQRIVGFVVLLVGVVMFLYGLDASDSFAERMSNTFTGHFSDRTTWYLIGGAAAGILGVLLVSFDKRGKNA